MKGLPDPLIFLGIEIDFLNGWFSIPISMISTIQFTGFLRIMQTRSVFED